MHSSLICSATIMFLLAGCGSELVPAPEQPPTPMPTCLSNAVPGTVTVFAAHVGPSEGIAFLNGKLYIAGGQGVRVVEADGSARIIAAIPGTVGMVAWQGALYAASGTDGTTPARFCSPSNQGVIWKITPDGQTSVFARGFISPNFLVVTPWNTLLVSDDCPRNSNIYEVDASGNTSIWNTTIASANGMGFDATFENLFVATTFNALPALQRLPINADHSPGTPATVRTFDAGSTPDGLAIDNQDNVFLTLNVLGRIDKLQPDGTDSVFAEGMMTPASLAFGDAPGFDACSMYVTSLLGDDVYQVSVGNGGRRLVQ